MKRSSRSHHAPKPATSRAHGWFFTFEGPEGSGKTTQIRKLSEYLTERGHTVLITREPGGTPCGDAIRSLFLQTPGGHLEAETEMFLMLAQRTEHWRKVIKPARDAGNIVLCDRYIDSSLAYQGYGRGLGADRILSIHQEFLGDCLPDLTIVFSIDPRDGLKRAQAGGKTRLDRMESEQIGFHHRVHAGYLELSHRFPERFAVVDASGQIDATYAQILAVVEAMHPELLT
ncbi:MAG TPA: dTMP kinase [Candidatus Ozemobacteraceae bacterium]|nr:dTMP kinase [Candidatus Ozemobacteraceae bacterium]